MPTLTTTLAGAVQFDGLSLATGLFSFDMLDAIPKTTRLAVHRIAYHSDAVDACSRIDYIFDAPAGAPSTAQVLAGRGLSPAITGPDGNVDFVACGGIVPRDKTGLHWALRVVTTGKSVAATVTVDYDIVPMPHASPEGAL